MSDEAATDKLIEAVARAMAEHYGQSPSFNWQKYHGVVRAALSAIEASGTHVIVPVEATNAMIAEGTVPLGWPLRSAGTIWQTMLASRPKVI